MRRLAALFIALLVAGTVPAQEVKETEADPAKTRPREFEKDGHKLVIYQPQLDGWDAYSPTVRPISWRVHFVEVEERRRGRLHEERR